MRFQPLHFGWVALPPQPKAVVVFIGGALVGTFPTLFFRGFLRILYDLDYAVVALPFRFTFRHWDIALSLSIYLAELQEELNALLITPGDGEHTKNACGQSRLPYLWIGHSLGCKYIALLEILTDVEKSKNESAVMKAFLEAEPSQAQEFMNKLELIEDNKVSLFNQPQLLVDPVIASLEAAIPWKPLAKIFAPLLKVFPSRENTFKLIEQSELFSLTKIFSLQSQTASDTILRLSHLKREQPLDPYCIIDLKNPKPLLGAHLAILGLSAPDQAIAEAISAAIPHADYDARIRQCGTST